MNAPDPAPEPICAFCGGAHEESACPGVVGRDEARRLVLAELKARSSEVFESDIKWVRPMLQSFELRAESGHRVCDPSASASAAWAELFFLAARVGEARLAADVELGTLQDYQHDAKVLRNIFRQLHTCEVLAADNAAAAEQLNSMYLSLTSRIAKGQYLDPRLGGIAADYSLNQEAVDLETWKRIWHMASRDNSRSSFGELVRVAEHALDKRTMVDD